MPGVGEVDQELRFTEGLNLVDPITLIKDNELTVCENFWYPGGVLTKRPGFFKFNTTAFTTATGGLIILGFANGFYYVRGRDSTDIYRVSASLGSIQALTNTSGDTYGWSIYVNGTTYFGGATLGIHTIAATTLSPTAITNSPRSNTVAFHKDRLFTDVWNAPGRLAFSHPGTLGWSATPSSLIDSGTIDVGVTGVEPITGLVSLGDLLVIFKINSTWVLYTQGSSANWSLRRIGNIGSVPSYGAASSYFYNGEVYFVSRTGIFKTNGSSFINVSEKIWNPVGNYSSVGTDFGQGHARITRFSDHLIIAGHFESYVTLGWAAGYCYVYNLNTHAWSSWAFMGRAIPFTDIFGLPSGAGGSEFALVATSGEGASANMYITTDAALDNYDLLLSNSNINSYADGFQYSSPGVGSAYTSTFRSKKFTAKVDKLLRLKWAGLGYMARGNPTFQWQGDDVLGSSFFPGYNVSLLKGYKIPGPGRVRSFVLQGNHSLTSPYEFYRANLHLTSKVPLLASGTP